MPATRDEGLHEQDGSNHGQGYIDVVDEPPIPHAPVDRSSEENRDEDAWQ